MWSKFSLAPTRATAARSLFSKQVQRTSSHRSFQVAYSTACCKKGAPISRRHALKRRNSSSSDTPTDKNAELARQLDVLVQEHGSLSRWAQGLSNVERDQLLQVLRGESVVAPTVDPTTVRPPTRRELQMVATNQAIPFIGFGIMDNSILILAGDAIDTSLGVTLGISTMCAAAIGNIVSDIAGLMFGSVIEDFCAQTLRMPVPNLSTAQRQLRSVRFASQWGCIVGVVIGCTIGMFPLLFIDASKAQARKREAHLESIFRDVVIEAGSLVGAARTCLYLLVGPDDSEGKATTSSPMPTADGKFLYNKYDDKAAASKGASGKERWLPLGRGIVSRAILTGESWNITDVATEPDFVPDIGFVEAGEPSNSTRSMLCVPVMDSSGRPIAVIQAINKIGKGREDDTDGAAVSLSQEPRSFTDNDVQILKALASHISVSLQRMYEHVDDENAETRLKDTISMLKKYGLSGLEEEDGRKSSRKKLERRPLFPEE
jgi:putative methionine-R-sulfoxide reductase with GAF domain